MPAPAGGFAVSPRSIRFLLPLAILTLQFAISSVSAPLARASSAPAPDAAAVAASIAQKYDSGVRRALAPAQAAYRQALALESAGNPDEAIRMLEAAVAFDPEYPDAHFTLARVLLFRQPDRAVGAFSEGFRILARSYPWQRHLLANLLTGIVFVWIVSLLLAVVGIVIRHLPHLRHVVQEVLSRRATPVVRNSAMGISFAPVLWGLGAVPTATLYSGLVSFRWTRREGTLVVLFLVSVLALAGGIGHLAPWAGAPTLEEPSLLVDRASSSAYDADLAAALLAWEARESTEALFPFALGSMARRSGDLDLAERQLTLAAVLRPQTPWILNNLGNVYFAREDYGRARQAYEAAAAADPNSVEPHFNLGQVYTKALMFSEASREQSRASALAFDRVSEFSKWSAPQLNRSVMDAAPPSRALWDLARRHARNRAPSALEGNRILRGVAGLTPPAPFALLFLPGLFLVFTLVGQVLGRNLSSLHCSNCQKIICRRCVKRMQQRAFCDECFQSVKDLKSSEFTKLLLTRQGRSASRRRTIGQAITTVVLPGGGQLLRGATLSGFFALMVMSAAAILVVSNGAPVPSLDVLPLSNPGWAKRIPLILLFLLTYAATVARYFATTTTNVPDLARETRPERPQRRRAHEVRR
ncbi:MAG TPA: tetratricopeptide repeat protein [Candidatus Eisenbacteria bacterium]|nr:tetratricopeptide repeat protein [Candidatus Eisenbacteria bacterium]